MLVMVSMVCESAWTALWVVAEVMTVLPRTGAVVVDETRLVVLLDEAAPGEDSLMVLDVRVAEADTGDCEVATAPTKTADVVFAKIIVSLLTWR